MKLIFNSFSLFSVIQKTIFAAVLLNMAKSSKNNVIVIPMIHKQALHCSKSTGFFFLLLYEIKNRGSSSSG